MALYACHRQKDLVKALSDVDPNVHPGAISRGTVIEVDPNVSIDLSNKYLRIPEGVTIRSNRRGTNFGAELWTSNLPNGTMLEVGGHDVRITGLRLRGPSRTTDADGPDSIGITVRDDLYLRSVIDHNDISDWTTQAVYVDGDPNLPTICRDHRDPRGFRPQNVRVARNFIHHNRKQNAGYGVAAHYGGFPLIEGNTFVSNRHAIKGDGNACTSYLAWYNLVLYDAPAQTKVGIPLWHTHDIDVHGTGDNGFGGGAGQYFEIARNTFLGTNRNNLELRGEPAYLVEFHHNVSLESRGDAIDCSDCGGGVNKLIVPDNNHFESINPTTRLGVGDFDGDGTDDVFLATGAAWYYAPAGKAEWRFLNTQTDGIGSLLFGDFDGDRRTDVFTQHGRDWLVSWGGASPWEKINESNPAISEFAIGDFDGDHRADVFYADGQAWYVSYGGVGPFKLLDTSSFRVVDLCFGDFNGDGKTDVFGVANGVWSVTYAGTVNWSLLRPRLTDSVAGLIVVDFNGNGRADIATAYGVKVSYDGRGNWTDLPARPGMFAAVGRFDANPGADILFFWTNGNYLGIQSSGLGAAIRHSNQDMR